MVGKNLWKSLGLTPLFKQSHLNPLVQYYYQTAFDAMSLNPLLRHL